MGQDDDPSPAEVAGYFREFGEGTARKLPLYHRLCLGAADDPEVVALLAGVPGRQRRPNLLLAAVHDELLAGADHPLAAWYPSVVTSARPVGSIGSDDDPYPAFRSLCLESSRLPVVVATRTTQTNEVGRSGALLPAFATVEAGVAGPLGLIELGASAGLNLAFDRYAYDYAEDGSLAPVTGSAVTLTPRSRGPHAIPVPSRFPDVAGRVGIDRHPVDIIDSESARWLVACQWPDQIDRLNRVRAAIEVVRTDPPLVEEGDMVTAVDRLVGTVAPHGHPCVYATWALAYLTFDEQRRLLATLDTIGSARDLSFLFAEQPDEVPGLPMPGPAGGSGSGPATVLVWIRWRHGNRSEQRLADMHPHGRWISWLGPSPQ